MKFRLIALALGSTVAWTTGSLAQHPAKPPASTLSIQFAGGTLLDYVQALKEAAPSLNIAMVVVEAKDIHVPPLKLDSVGYYASLQLLQGNYRLRDGTSVRLLVMDLGVPREGENGNPVYKIWSERAEGHKSSAQVRVWNIGELLGSDRKVEDVLTAVETAIGMLEGRDKARMQYHAETSLLVASGEPEQLLAIDRVIEQIRVEQRRQDQLAGAAMSTDAIGGLFDWVERMRRFDAEQAAKDAPREQAEAKVKEVTQLLESVRTELQQRDRKIQELERRLREKEGRN